MPTHRITRGLRLPITGAPLASIEDGRPVRRVALLAADYAGLRPTMHVSVGDSGLPRPAPVRGQDDAGGAPHGPGGRYGEGDQPRRAARPAVGGHRAEPGRAGGAGARGGQVRCLVGASPQRHDRGRGPGSAPRVGTVDGVAGRPFGRVADPATRPHSIFVHRHRHQPPRTRRGGHPAGPGGSLRARAGSPGAVDPGAGVRLHRTRPASARAGLGRQPDPARGLRRGASGRDGRRAYPHPGSGGPPQGGLAHRRAGRHRDGPPLSDRGARRLPYRGAGRTSG